MIILWLILTELNFTIRIRIFRRTYFWNIFPELIKIIYIFFIVPEELKDGVPALSINHGSGILTLQLPKSSAITDRRWHRLDIISDGKVEIQKEKEREREREVDGWMMDG